MAHAAGSRAPLAWRWLLGLAAVELAVYALSSGPLAYGYMSDEFYYLDCAQRLAWGYVDHPPLSIGVLALVRATLGTSLLALRLVPALLACAALALAALLARELGGGRAAQGLAALGVVVSPVYLALAGFYSMNAFEPALWGAAALLVARIAGGAGARAWLGLGVVLGVGLLNKLSMSWLGFGLAVGLVATPQRRWLATPWPWVSAAVALAIFAPHLAWQAQNDWPTLEFMRNATTEKMLAKSPGRFATDQLLVMGPLLAPLWLAGLVWYFASEDGRRYRILAWIWIAVVALLAASGTVRANYAAPAYLVLLAAGGVAFERIARARAWHWLPPVAAALFLLGGAAMAPLATPLLRPEQLVAYQRSLGIEAPVDQVDELGALPIHFALRFGWRELVDAVDAAYASLSPEERRRAVVLGWLFGDTGAVNFLGPARGLPRAIGGHNNYWLWGPGDATGDVLLAVALTDEGLRDRYSDVRRVAEVDCRWCMPDVGRLGVYVARAPRLPITDWWPRVKRYI